MSLPCRNHYTPQELLCNSGYLIYSSLFFLGKKFKYSTLNSLVSLQNAANSPVKTNRWNSRFGFWKSKGSKCTVVKKIGKYPTNSQIQLLQAYPLCYTWKPKSSRYLRNFCYFENTDMHGCQNPLNLMSDISQFYGPIIALTASEGKTCIFWNGNAL